MGRVYRGGDGARIRVEGQAPLPEESDAEGEEEDAADPAGRESLVPTADGYLCHAGHVSGSGSGQEPHENRLVQGDSAQDQQSEGGQKRSNGYPAVVTHVSHVTNHP